MRKLVLIISLVFSVFFAYAITFALTEIIRLLNKWMLGISPDCILLSDFPRCQEAEASLRVLGYFSLALVFTVIIVGFIADRLKIALLGSIILYLPVIGYFAFTMFFLAGVGVLRFLWIPFIDSEILIRLGFITHLPLKILNFLASSTASLLVSNTSWEFTVPICFAFMITGLSIFTVSSATWIYDRLVCKKLSLHGVYKYSRHPQYLGFIVWSYGFFSLASTAESGRGWAPPMPGLPWLITTMLIITIALLEEVKLRRELSTKYLEYAGQTPFMIPLPRPILKILAHSSRKITGREFPETRSDVFKAMLAYSALIMLVSLCLSHFEL
ncbi:MAG: DUF1295 domain-containing protein [Thermosphaera sp.]